MITYPYIIGAHLTELMGIFELNNIRNAPQYPAYINFAKYETVANILRHDYTPPPKYITLLIFPRGRFVRKCQSGSYRLFKVSAIAEWLSSELERCATIEDRQLQDRSFAVEPVKM
jgi:hypothetical protein